MIQNLVEQVCLIDGHRVMTVATVEEACALIAQSGSDAFALGVIDTAALGTCDQPRQRMAHDLCQDRTAARLGLPLVFLDGMFSHDVFLKRCADTGCVLSKPFRPAVFAAMIRRFFQDDERLNDEGDHA